MEPWPPVAGRSSMPPLRTGKCIDLVCISLSEQGVRFLWSLWVALDAIHGETQSWRDSCERSASCSLCLSLRTQWQPDFRCADAIFCWIAYRNPQPRRLRWYIELLTRVEVATTNLFEAFHPNSFMAG